MATRKMKNGIRGQIIERVYLFCYINTEFIYIMIYFIR